jgi:DNA helicase-2/ATP-dependent DNA helicase PcrA
MQDMSFGPSWLGFAARPDTQHNRQAASALRGNDLAPPVKKTTNYTGKTYNSADSVRDFFKRRTDESGAGDQASEAGPKDSGSRSLPRKAKPDTRHSTPDTGFRVGARVKHAKYGAGVVLRSEGAGDDAKLTVSFPGYGLKKFVAKFAALEKI